MRPLPLSRLAVVILAALVSSCGFHLQGRTPLPEFLRTAYVEAADPQTDFVQSLHKALRVSGAHPAQERDRASAVVNILKDEVSRRVLSVSAANRPSEYEVSYTVRFSVSRGDQEVLAPREVSATRDFSFDERLLLAKENEETILRETMARDLADIVMRQLSSL